MKKDRLLIIIYLILIIIISFPIKIKESKADVIRIVGTGMGNFLPEENVSLMMTNASVLFNIDAVYHHRKININFTGNYTIFNPDKAKNITLAAPFSTLLTNLESSCVIKINNSSIPYGFLEYNYTLSPWDQYLDWRYMSMRKFIIINVTIPENNSITVEYSFNAYVDKPENYDGLDIFYDVGTSRAWNGTITERVEFRVFGKHPDSYSEYREDHFEYNCTISDIEDGISYVWEWENEIINVDSVYISFSYYNPWGRLFPFIFFPLLIGGLIIIIVLARRRDKRRARERMIFLNTN